MRTLLYLNLDFPPLTGPGIWRALGFVKYLPRNGWRSVVLCSDRSPAYNRRDESLLEQIPPGTEIHRISSHFEGDIAGWMERTADRTTLRSLAWFLRGIHWRFVRDYPDVHFHWACKVAARGIWLTARRKVDCLLTSGPPHIAHAAGLMIKRATGIPWVMDYRDQWTEDRFQVKQNRYQPGLFRRLEQAANRQSDAVMAVSPVYLERLSERYPGGKSAEQYHLIRNGHDLSDDLIERSLTRPQNERLRIHFNGTAQVGLPFKLILDLIDRLPPEQRPRFTFTGMPSGFRDEVAGRGWQEWIADLGPMEHGRSIEHCLTCDVLLAMANPDPAWRGTIPGKVYEAIALGRHLLAIVAPGSAVGPLIQECGNGTLVDGSDVEDLHRAVVRILELHRTGCLNADQDPVRRRVLAEKYSRREQTRELVALINHLAV